MNWTNELAAEELGLMRGVTIAVVTNNKDPKKLGRVKVKFPKLDDKYESDWARVVSFMGGKDRGAYFIPEVEDEVLVAFESGSIHRPYIVGCLWNGEDKPPKKGPNDKNDVRLIRSRSGHEIRLTDTKGKEKIEIIDAKEKNKITIDTKKGKIELKGDKEIKIDCKDGKIVLEAKTLEIKTSGAMELKAGGELKLEGQTVKIKGSKVDIN